MLGVLAAFDNPARRGLVAELVEPHDISNATSLNTAVMTGSRIFGPALATLMVATVGHGVVLPAQRGLVRGGPGSLFALRPDELHPSPLAAERRAPGPRGARVRRPAAADCS